MFGLTLDSASALDLASLKLDSKVLRFLVANPNLCSASSSCALRLALSAADLVHLLEKKNREIKILNMFLYLKIVNT